MTGDVFKMKGESVNSYQQLTIRQHYIPRMYLKNFGWKTTKKNINIQVFDKVSRKSQIRNTKTVVCKDFYYESENPQEIESYLSEIESKSSKILEKIIEDRNLSILSEKQNKSILIEFIMNLYIRTSKSRRILFNQISEYILLMRNYIPVQKRYIKWDHYNVKRIDSLLVQKILSLCNISNFTRISSLNIFHFLYYLLERRNNFKSRSHFSQVNDVINLFYWIKPKFRKYIAFFLDEEKFGSNLKKYLKFLCYHLYQRISDTYKQQSIHGLQVNGKNVINKIEKKLKNNKIIPNAGLREFHKMFIRSCKNKKNLFNDWKFKIFINTTNIKFITSDCPVVIDGKKRTKINYMPSRIYLPINPQILIVLYDPNCNSNLVKLPIQISRDFVEFINSNIIGRAVRYIFINENNLKFNYKRLCRNFDSIISQISIFKYGLFCFELIEKKKSIPTYYIEI